MDGPDVTSNTVLAIEYCMRNPRWRLSIQTHKLVGVR
jgi:organic radical activating enzyme